MKAKPAEKNAFRDAAGDILYCLLFVLTTVLTLYRQDGYVALGEAKSRVLLYTGLAAAGLFLLLFLARLIAKKTTVSSVGAWTRAASVSSEYRTNHLFFAAYLICCALSFLFAKDRAQSLWGAAGWRMGFATILLCLFFYAAYAGWFSVRAGFTGILLAAPALASFIAILNRFGVYIEAFRMRTASGFLSTIGNINWLTGFLSVFLPASLGLMTTAKKTRDVALLAAVSAIFIVAALVQGSDSALLVFVATYMVLFFTGAQNRRLWTRFLLALGLLGVCMETTFLLARLFRDRFTYDAQGSVVLRLCDLQIGLVLIAMSVALYEYSKRRNEQPFPTTACVRLCAIVTCAIIAALIAAAVVIAAGLQKTPQTIPDDFGNGRGAVWRVSIETLKTFSPLRILFGAGPDGFYAYQTQTPRLAEMSYELFGGSMLTNAHCIFLTKLINEGLFGMVAYFGFLISAGVALAKKICLTPEHPIACAALGALCAYLLNGTVSFEQALSTPYLFLLLGMARAE